MRYAPGTLALACLACAAAAQAQWNPEITASIGAGYGNIALSQSVLSGTRRLGNQQAASKPATAAAGTLDYTPDASLSARLRESMIDSFSQQNPAQRGQLEKAFANDAVLKSFDRFMSAHGYSSHNVADAMTALLVVCWEISTGGQASSGQVAGANRQIRGVFLKSPQLSGMSNAERQEMAEHIAYQVVLSASARNEYLRSNDQAHLEQLRGSAASLMRQQGIDLARLRLTDEGFVKSS